MLHSNLIIVICLFLFTLQVNCFSVLREAGCPVAEVISPCFCENNPYTVLECQNISKSDDLERVFQNSEGYNYREIHILYSSLEYLPKAMFDKTEVRSLHLKNVSLAAPFDDQPENLHILENLYIENTRVASSMTWDLLENLTQLRRLTIYFNSIRTLNTEFSQHVTKTLQHINFYDTDTMRIDQGVLTQFTHLTEVAMDSCKLTSLSRDIFPTPFNVEVLSFNDNLLTFIPDDIFTQMPYLKKLELRSNHISVIPEAAFESNIARISHVSFEGNPLKCDCLLQWVVINKPSHLRGTCNSPKRLYGRELENLEKTDLNC